jgi:hypothetical protein
MPKLRHLSLALTAAALTAGAARARADVIADLYSTGVNSAHATMGNGSADAHYALVSSPVGSGTAFVVNPGGFPVPPWVANDPVGTPGGSMWISGPVTPTTNEPNGIYDYRTTFTIGAGFNAATASIIGQLTADDRVSVRLNGVLEVPSDPDQGYGSLFPFSITSGFVSGTNTLDFLVENTHDAVEGLRVNMTGTVAVPEPGPLALAGVGSLLGGAVWARRRRRATAAA